MEQNFCQSCGMPMTTSEMYGTNKDNSLNNEYCVYCYKDGHFTQDLTMDEMIERCAEFVNEYNKDAEQKLTKEEAVIRMKQYFPLLKRWKK
ncbi:MAG: zinc ribbon domain-containing protein [Dysgonomonas sp.]